MHGMYVKMIEWRFTSSETEKQQRKLQYGWWSS